MSASIAKRRARQARAARDLEEKLNFLADAIYQVSDTLAEWEEQTKRGGVHSAVPVGLGRNFAGSRARNALGGGGLLKAVFSSKG